MKTDTVCRVAPCDQSVTERPRYYARQLITADDLTLEQEYFRSKLRTHNRMMHGWGVVCGALVCLVPKAPGSNTGNGSNKNGGSTSKDEEKFEPWKVMVKPGYILGPYGDEINLDCTRIVDLRTAGVTGVTGEACVEASDPWCSEVFEQKDADHLYIAVRYQEIATRPVRVQPVGCGCDDTRCEPSRLRDGYQIAVLDHCPDVQANPPRLEDLGRGSIPQCPPCPEEPWVVLAEVTLGANGKITMIDNCACRPLVLSFDNFWWQCREIKITSLSSKTFIADDTEQPLEIGGHDLDLIDKISFGDVQYNITDQQPTNLKGKVRFPLNTKTGPLQMKVTAKEPSQSFAIEKAITVQTRGSRLTQPAEGRSPSPPQAEPAKPAAKQGRQRGKDKEDA